MSKILLKIFDLYPSMFDSQSMLLLYGFLLAILIASLAYRARSLSKSGTFAAMLIGTIIFGLGGIPWAVLLLIFFVTSTALSRAFKKRKQGLSEKYSKGDQRDAGQVLGNGGLAAAFVIFHYFYPESNIGWIGFAASLAAVNADTWATELGILNPTPPRMVTDIRKRVEKGTSGGVSLVGTLASLAGSALIAALASLFTDIVPLRDNWSLFPLITLAGLAGSLFDSFLGATVQAMYFCPKDNKETEKHPFHACGTETVHVRGWKWLTNDWVNFACGVVGALIGILLVKLLA